MEEEFEVFIGSVREAGNGSKEITLPYRLVKFAGLETGDLVKIWIKKVEGVGN